MWLFITTSLPDGHIFVERSFHKHQSARLRKHKVVEKQECFQFQQYNKYAASQTRLFTDPGTAQRNSRERHQKGSHPPSVGRDADRRWRCSEDVTSFFGKGRFLKYLIFRAVQTHSCLRSRAVKTDIGWQKMCRFRVSKHTSSVSVAKISSQQWQHFESTQTQQQNSRMWLKSSQWSHTEAKITWSVTQCYLQFISTLLLPSKTKRWDAHACLQSWRIYFSTFRMNCSTF